MRDRSVTLSGMVQNTNLLKGGHALTSPKGGRPCPLSTLGYTVVGHLVFRQLNRDAKVPSDQHQALAGISLFREWVNARKDNNTIGFKLNNSNQWRCPGWVRGRATQG